MKMINVMKGKIQKELFNCVIQPQLLLFVNLSVVQQIYYTCLSHQIFIEYDNKTKSFIQLALYSPFCSKKLSQSIRQIYSSTLEVLALRSKSFLAHFSICRCTISNRIEQLLQLWQIFCMRTFFCNESDLSGKEI